ncbi:methylglyoxal synthase [Psychrosphaera sp. B3R10]|uniref:methylglyoxal synthase n=1 Tax=unclassified Psychrosphaera TaxID=2641570 RepID=UPI001C0A410C|nr:MULTISPECIES: methylglyoxal synthase [unclassified Psychrosphaera]MBU2881028.1 methylglyoxal synthase [Psychrosphaera sp. I2R16]MBU2989952.1 methylglyoxal synthase [Psychrosphaera sp. B3R10]
MIKRIALVAHDKKKPAIIEWAKKHSDKLQKHTLFATGTTGRLIKENAPLLNLTPLKSGPLGGDQQLGAMIAEGKLDILFFFTDPMTPQPHDVDIKALLRLSTMYNCVVACNLATADFVIESPLFEEPQDHTVDFSEYSERIV